MRINVHHHHHHHRPSTKTSIIATILLITGCQTPKPIVAPSQEHLPKKIFETRRSNKPCHSREECYASINDALADNWRRTLTSRNGMAVVVELSIQQNGTVTATKIIRSSGDNSTDQSVLTAIKRASPISEISGLSAEIYEKEFRSIKIGFVVGE